MYPPGWTVNDLLSMKNALTGVGSDVKRNQVRGLWRRRQNDLWFGERSPHLHVFRTEDTRRQDP